MSASEDKRLILHDVRVTASGKSGSGAVASLAGHSSWVLSTAISPDGRLALSGYFSLLILDVWCAIVLTCLYVDLRTRL
jgi:WD repeat-containing protein 61